MGQLGHQVQVILDILMVLAVVLQRQEYMVEVVILHIMFKNGTVQLGQMVVVLIRKDMAGDLLAQLLQC